MRQPSEDSRGEGRWVRHMVVYLVAGAFALTLAVLAFWQQVTIRDLPREAAGPVRTSSFALLGIFGLGTLAGLRGLALLRRSASQEQQVDQACRESRELRDSYRAVIENLPIGLFTYTKGTFNFSNWAWDVQMMREEGETRPHAFESTLVDEDREHVLEAFRRFEERHEPFSIGYRLKAEGGGMRYVESSGVPVYSSDGSYQHLLGFNLDVTQKTLADDALVRAHEELQRKHEQLTDALHDLEDHVQGMVRSLIKAIEAKDPYTAGHSERVMRYCLRIGRRMGLPLEQLKVLRIGALIHDIGKIGVPDQVLTKPSGLSQEEFELVKLHPETGFSIIEHLPPFSECTGIVRWHHERLDGTGYPDGLSGEEIPLLVRICAVADAFDAMTSDRAYRNSLPLDVALSELRKDGEKGKLDLEVVSALEWAISSGGFESPTVAHAA